MPESAPRLPDPAAPTFPGDLLLAAGAARALLRPRAGGRVARLWLAAPDGRPLDVLHPYDTPDVDPLRWAKGGIYPLVPYSNRIAQARLPTPDGELALAPHPDAAPHTLHGPAHGLPWQTEQTGPAHAVLTLDRPASPAWPGRYRVTQHIHLTPDSLSLRLHFTNRDTRTLPAGLGFHPYFRHLPSARLRYRAAWAWDRSDDFLATGARPLPQPDPQAGPAPLPPGTLTDYLSGWSGPLELELPEGLVLRLDGDAVLTHLVIHRPPQPHYLCVEPVSHVADGFRLAAQGLPGTGTVLLAPEESLSATFTLRLQPGFST